jgi:hypothetical protein
MKFQSISLSEMDEVSLMKRTDTKFVVHISKLIEILSLVVSDYRILEIDGRRIMSYESLYFDTAKSKFYTDHHNDRSNRIKVRIRNYKESHLYFLEIKQKNNKGVTNKSRIQLNNFEENLSSRSQEFIYTTIKEDYCLKPALWNSFRRITLVNIQNKERITIDLGINFSFDNKKEFLEDLVIVEVKQERYNRKTPIVSTLKSFRSSPYSISKYCIGMLRLFPDLKYNRFKKKLLKIENLV